MADAELTERLSAAFARARDKLRAARHLLDAGLPAEAVSPAYYAAFHAAEAALAVEGYEPRSHQGVKNLFGLRFVKTGRLPAELASALRELMDERQNGDYAVFPAITPEDAAEAVAAAEHFVGEVERFVQAQGFSTA